MARTSKKKAVRKRGPKTQGTRGAQGLPWPLLRRVGLWLALLLVFFFSLALTVYLFFFYVPSAQAAKVSVEMVLDEPPAEVAPASDVLGPTPVKSALGAKGLPRAAIIIDDMGYYQRVGQDLLAMDLNLTFSFLPFARYTAELVEAAHQDDRTILLHQPMQPRSSRYDPGSGALLVKDGLARQEMFLLENLLAVPYAVGVNNHMGSLYMADEMMMERLMLLLHRQGLFFVDSLTASDSVAAEVARIQGVRMVARDIFLDHVRKPEAICNQLRDLARIAERRGWAVAIGHPYRETVTALRRCGKELQKRVELVDIQDLLPDIQQKDEKVAVSSGGRVEREER